MIPSSFTLLGCKWNVYEVDDMLEMGLCIPDSYIIKLRRSLPQQAKEATFFHELEHAFRFMLGMNDHNELEVDVIGGMLYQFIQEVYMPVNQKKMKALKQEYGAKKGKQVYYAMENKAKTEAKNKKKK